MFVRTYVRTYVRKYAWKLEADIGCIPLVIMHKRAARETYIRIFRPVRTYVCTSNVSFQVLRVLLNTFHHVSWFARSHYDSLEMRIFDERLPSK